MATPQIALIQQLPAEAPLQRGKRVRRVNLLLLFGMAIAVGAVLIGIHCTGISIGYFFQPTGAVIVLGGTLGVVLVTTPSSALLNSFRRVVALIAASEVNGEAVAEEIVQYARLARRGGVLSIEPLLDKANTGSFAMRCSSPPTLGIATACRPSSRPNCA